MARQTAGRQQLGSFAPKFAELNDDVLFGEVWSREKQLSLRDRSLVTVTALMAQGLTDESFRFHLETARKNGVTREEIAEILTHAAFYAGWPKAWAAFRMAKEVWADAAPALTDRERFQSEIMFPIGDPNDAFAEYFTGQSYLAPVSTDQVMIYNVTFEPGCRNHWHIHHAKSGGGQMLICVGGRGRSGEGQGSHCADAWKGHPYPCGSKALARRSRGQLDGAPCSRGCRNKDFQ